MIEKKNQQIQQTKDIVKNIITPEQWRKIQETTKKYRELAKKINSKRKNNIQGIIIIAIIALGFFIYILILAYTKTKTINSRLSELNTLSSYNTDILKTNKTTNNLLNSISTINELIESNKSTIDEMGRYTKYKENLQLSYTYFLQYLLLPKLNIWKKLYTNIVKTDIIGKDYLDENPYNDINLLQKRTDFFSNTDNNQINQIKNLEIGNIIEEENGLYGIKMNFDFIAPSKNALLFLIDKLSMTSDKENISLLGEFLYYLRQQIKTDKKQQIEELQKQGIFSGEIKNSDKLIGYSVYSWIFNGEETKLIDDALINRTIFSMMGCNPGNESECFYGFRNKYRNISSLAYTLGIQNNQNKKSDLKNFLKNLPPLMAIQQFNFDKIQDNSIIQTANTKYQGKISLEIYGQSISGQEIDEIAQNLGQKCFGENKKLLVEDAQKIINDTIQKKENIIDGNQDAGKNIWDLKSIIDNINTQYSTANNYTKTIRLFEIYRMLNENGLCKTI